MSHSGLPLKRRRRYRASLLANLFDTFKPNLIAWLGDAQNGIDKIFANENRGTNGTFSSVSVSGDLLPLGKLR